MTEASKLATATGGAAATAPLPTRGSSSSWHRSMAVCAALATAGLVLSGCGNTDSPSSTASPSIVVSPQSPRASSPSVPVAAPAGTPEIDGFELIFATQYPGSAQDQLLPTPASEDSSGAADSGGVGVDGVLTADAAVAVYHNDLDAMKFQMTGYQISTGEQEWSRSGEGWISCHEGSLVVCETLTYSQGVWAAEDPGVLNVDSGGMRLLDVGAPDTFRFVGSHDDVAYFLTWDGTRSIHMTGFDASGAPVIDKNLKLDTPGAGAGAVASIETWMAGGMAWVRVPGAKPGVYVSAANLFAQADVQTPCISAADGVLCTASDDRATMVAIDDRGKEAWRRTTHSVSIASSGESEATLDDIREVFLDSNPTATHRPDPGTVPGPGDPTGPATAGAGNGTKVADGGDGATKVVATPTAEPQDMHDLRLALPESADQMYVVSTGQGVALATRSGSVLHLPGHGEVDLADRALEAIDLSHEVAVIDVSRSAEGTGETGAARVRSSILIDGEGTVLSELSTKRAAELLEGSELAEQLEAHHFAWQGSNLVFRDDASGIAAVYRQN